MPARRLVRRSRAVAAALLADDEHQADARFAVARSRSAAATCAARMPFASHDAAAVQAIAFDAARERTAARSRSAWRTRPTATARRPAVAMTLKRVVVDRLLGDRRSRGRAGSRASQRPHSPSRPVVESMSTSARRRERDDVYRIHASSSVRVSVRESRYFDDHRRRERQAPLGALAGRDRARAGHDDGAFGHDERAIGGRLDDLAARRDRRPASIRSAPCRRAMTARALMIAPS